MENGIFDIFSTEEEKDIYLDVTFFKPVGDSISGNLLSLIKEAGYFELGGMMPYFYDTRQAKKRGDNSLLAVTITDELLEAIRFYSHYKESANHTHKLRPNCPHCWNYSHVGIKSNYGKKPTDKDATRIVVALGKWGKVTELK